MSRIQANYTRYNTEDLERLIVYAYELCKPGGARDRAQASRKYGKLEPLSQAFLEEKWVFADYGKTAVGRKDVVKFQSAETSNYVRVVKPEALWSNPVESLSALGCENPILPSWAIAEIVWRFAKSQKYCYRGNGALRGGDAWSIGELIKSFPPPQVRIMAKPEQRLPKVQGGLQRKNWLVGGAKKAADFCWYAIHQGRKGKFASDFYRGGREMKKALGHAQKMKSVELVEHLEGCIKYHGEIEKAMKYLVQELNEVARMVNGS